jgi:molybdopterin-containing oxidoreductase family iron-sulfur binding subunit
MMDNNRRKFLKLTGLAALGVSTGKLEKIFGKDNHSALAYSDIVPSRFNPSPEEDAKTRLAMVIDLNKCLVEEGCDACSKACHTIHNVPKINNQKHAVKWIWKEPYENTFLDSENFYQKDDLKEKSVPVFCNHCDNPPCVKVCPTQATWKREDGIVMMDWHRCIGCRYCIVACPYGSRSFNWKDPRPYIPQITAEFPTRTKGVVEKCTFCDERIAKGLLPACVEACKAKAMVFGNLSDPKSEVRALLKENFSIRRKPGLGTNPEIYYLV